ncbi:conjugative transposon protein TraM [Flavivirga jejuensis]|uniref:Conjugative transposon protein TraM n=1 Tax=Flavivirga jejuensis TaxID=870487 RepID=A0ABT8WUT5_9FLAO|nr:conjugative transposon protein TraM [Flavivirga jejuensis]MDO5976951.1 conjugative transposon protein TraM [Flavivirga jejuensis]
MKLDKKKIAFIVVIAIVLIFIIGYSVMTFGKNDDSGGELTQPTVPALETVQDEYTSRLDAINDLKEVRQTNAPSIYDEKFLDSSGVYDPNRIEKEKARIVDSIYKNGRIDYSTGSYRNLVKDNVVSSVAIKEKKDTEIKIESTRPTIKEMALDQQLFFASSPKTNDLITETPELHAVVDGQQTIKIHDRLRMLTTKDININGLLIPKNTFIYGIVNFKPNRVLLSIENINHKPMIFKAYDFQDGLEGLYIKNTFRTEATREIVDDAVDDINVPGVPQVKGLKKIFQRSNRQVKVTVNNNYKLILKADNRQ